MSSSLRLLLEDYLGLMREEGELDAFLPLLLSAMGHEIVFRSQKGVKQYGVDISSVGRDFDGKRKLFLWLVKRGDIGRAEWNSGPQSVRQSIDDVGDVYLLSHIAPQHAALGKKLVVVTNGDFAPALNQTLASYLGSWAARHGAEAELVNGSTLAALTEVHLLDEHVLPPPDRVLFRRMLASAGSPELSVAVGQRLIGGMVESAAAPGGSQAAARKRLLTGLRGARTALSALFHWAQLEGNLLAPYRLSEFAVLSVWSRFHERLANGEKELVREFYALLIQMADIAEAFHRKLGLHYATKDALAHTLGDSLLVADAVFREIGRLAFQGYFWAFFAVAENSEAARSNADAYIERLRALLATHGASQSPAFDHHAASIHTAMLLLALSGHREEARQWLQQLAQRLARAARAKKYWPSVAPFEDALLVWHGMEEPAEEFRRSSTLTPILLLWAAALEKPASYALIGEQVIPEVEGTTLNFWSPDAGYDSFVADPHALHEHGVGEGALYVPENPAAFLEHYSKPLASVAPIEASSWHRARAPYIPLLCALHWQLQGPREMLVKHAIAAVAGDAAKAPASPPGAEAP